MSVDTNDSSHVDLLYVFFYWFFSLHHSFHTLLWSNDFWYTTPYTAYIEWAPYDLLLVVPRVAQPGPFFLRGNVWPPNLVKAQIRLERPDRSDIWQGVWQHCCRGTSQLSDQYSYFSTKFSMWHCELGKNVLTLKAYRPWVHRIPKAQNNANNSVSVKCKQFILCITDALCIFT